MANDNLDIYIIARVNLFRLCKMAISKKSQPGAVRLMVSYTNAPVRVVTT